jgi:hypothetical protein
MSDAVQSSVTKPTSFWMLCTLSKVRSGQYVSPSELAQAKRTNRGAPTPPEIEQYEIDLLEKKIKPPRGAKPKGDENRDELVLIYYDDFLARLKRGKGLLHGSEPQRKALLKNKNRGIKASPSQRAARLTILALSKRKEEIGGRLVSAESVPKIASRVRMVLKAKGLYDPNWRDDAFSPLPRGW